MTVVLRKEKRGNGKVYYKLYSEKRVNGKVVQKYVGYLGKSKNEIDPEIMLQYVQRLLKIGISQDSINDILKKLSKLVGSMSSTSPSIENWRSTTRRRWQTFWGSTSETR